MGAVKSTLAINDGMTPALRHINKAMSLMLNNFNAVQRASGNAIDTKDLAIAKRELGKANDCLDAMENEYRNINRQQESFNSKVNAGSSAMGGLWNKVKGVAAAYLGMKGVSWVKDSLTLFDTQNAAETQLKTVMKNMGVAENAFDSLKAKASTIQGDTLYGDEIMLGGAAEFATYMSDDKAIEVMMDTLANYAAGMSGGGEVGYEEMVNYATGLGKIMTGSYDAMTKKGFEFTEQQKKIIETGTDMEKALTISEVINESWAGLGESMANTPEGKIIQMNNTFGDMREELGEKCYPAVMHLFNTIGSNSDKIHGIVVGLSKPINFIVTLLSWLIGAASGVYSFFANNWGLIAPIVTGIAFALGLYGAALLINKTYLGLETAAKVISTVAAVVHKKAIDDEQRALFGASAAQQAFNMAMLSSPVTWVLLIIIAIIAAIYMIVGAINKVTGSSISATGVILGALATAGAFIWDLFLGLLEMVLGIINYMINPFVEIANFIGNVFTNPVSSIIYLFQGMADNVLAMIQKIASGLDFVFGSNMADTVQGWRDDLKGKADNLVKEYAPEENYQDIISNVDLSVEGLGLKRIEYSDAYLAGYNLGEKVDDKLGDMLSFDNLTKGVDIPSMGDNIEGISDDTTSLSDSVDTSSEELEYLRDIAEREAVNRFTTAEVKVDFNNNNSITSDVDVDGVISRWTEEFKEAVSTAAEGDY